MGYDYVLSVVAWRGGMTIKEMKETLNAKAQEMADGLPGIYGRVELTFNNGKFVHGKFDVSFKPEKQRKDV